MPPIEFLIPFLIATVVFAFTPGPGMIYMAVQTMTHGSKSGWLSSFAFHIASYFHILLAAFGITVVLKTAPVLLLALKVAGAAYLVYMGIRLILHQTTLTSSTPHPKRHRSSAFKDSLIVELLNPKSALFYFAFLPQFTSSDASAALWVQIITLGVLANILFSLADGICILAARLLVVKAAANGWVTRLGRKASGCILVTMGTKVAFDAQ